MQKHKKVGNIKIIAHFWIGRRVKRLFIAKFFAKVRYLSFVYVMLQESLWHCKIVGGGFLPVRAENRPYGIMTK